MRPHQTFCPVALERKHMAHQAQMFLCFMFPMPGRSGTLLLIFVNLGKLSAPAPLIKVLVVVLVLVLSVLPKSSLPSLLLKLMAMLEASGRRLREGKRDTQKHVNRSSSSMEISIFKRMLLSKQMEGALWTRNICGQEGIMGNLGIWKIIEHPLLQTPRCHNRLQGSLTSQKNTCTNGMQLLRMSGNGCHKQFRYNQRQRYMVLDGSSLPSRLIAATCDSQALHLQRHIRSVFRIFCVRFFFLTKSYFNRLALHVACLYLQDRYLRYRRICSKFV
eukprot:284819578_3